MVDKKENIFRFFLYQLRKERDEYYVSQEEQDSFYEILLKMMVSK